MQSLKWFIYSRPIASSIAYCRCGSTDLVLNFKPFITIFVLDKKINWKTKDKESCQQELMEARNLRLLLIKNIKSKIQWFLTVVCLSSVIVQVLRSEIDRSQKRSECERSNANWDRSKRVWDRSKRVWTLSQSKLRSI